MVELPNISGQFTGEYAVKALMFDNTAFSLFAPRESLKFDVEPSGDQGGTWADKDCCGGTKDDLYAVNLPRPTFENGRSVTVKMEKFGRPK